MERNDEDAIKELVENGLITKSFDRFLRSKNRSTIKLLAKAALVSSYKVRENAKKLKIPLLIVRNNILIQVNPDGSEIFVKILPKPIIIPKRFILK